MMLERVICFDFHFVFVHCFHVDIVTFRRMLYLFIFSLSLSFFIVFSFSKLLKFYTL